MSSTVPTMSSTAPTMSSTVFLLGGGTAARSIPRKRKTRCCYGKNGLLPVYSQRSALGQGVIIFLNGERRTVERYGVYINIW